MMKCIQCNAEIDKGEHYVEWGGYNYCGTSCVVDELRDKDGLEEKVREDN